MARYIVAVIKTLIISGDKGVIVHDGWIIQQLNIFKATAISVMTVCDIWGSPHMYQFYSIVWWDAFKFHKYVPKF